MPAGCTGLSDEIFLERIQLYGFHGVHPEERALGQRFTVDVRVACDLTEAARRDELEATISYSAIYRIVKAIVEGPRRLLLESLAGAIVDAILAEFPAATAAEVTVRKPGAPVQGAVFDAAGVTIRRQRREGTSGVREAGMAHDEFHSS